MGHVKMGKWDVPAIQHRHTSTSQISDANKEDKSLAYQHVECGRMLDVRIDYRDDRFDTFTFVRPIGLDANLNCHQHHYVIEGSRRCTSTCIYWTYTARWDESRVIHRVFYAIRTEDSLHNFDRHLSRHQLHLLIIIMQLIILQDHVDSSIHVRGL